MRTIEQAYGEYVAELIRYREWVNQRKSIYGKGHPMEIWDNCDWHKIEAWNNSLKIVRQVLGLTDEEDREADRRAGISPSNLTE